ncbi:hypothetical protein [Streptomyces radicis]|uniref:Uncharacterized protein n=1 Tax=Streptomyces radicis TaxID=1750517 RepID=A0A3A9W6Y9_9ACTN|nr:hypothetical protein [Streptomyces radicis]RKN08579.1 hypothetical protein D7319_14360 [Streptomyces radicis]RKN21737.1 hypothetical protein D7318_15315 [Streptomyces radicis]
MRYAYRCETCDSTAPARDTGVEAAVDRDHHREEHHTTSCPPTDLIVDFPTSGDKGGTAGRFLVVGVLMGVIQALAMWLQASRRLHTAIALTAAFVITLTLAIAWL